MKKMKNIILYLIIIGLIIFNIVNFNKNVVLGNAKIILKSMEESTQVLNLNNTIENLNEAHTDYANYVQTSKQKIANAINMYPNNNATGENTLEEFSTMISNITDIPQNTYYYQSGTEGDSSTIVRYKKVGTQYYVCDEHGIVASNTTATDVSSKTLIPYSATTSKNLSAGSAGYGSGSLYLGDGTDNTTYVGDLKTCVVINTVMYTQLAEDTQVVKNSIDISTLYPEYKNITSENIHIEPLTIYCTTGSAFSNYSYVSYEYDSSTGIISVVLTGRGTSGNAAKNRAWYVYSKAGMEIPVNIIIVK